MTFRVSKLRESKSLKPELIEVITIVADRFDDELLSRTRFYNDEYGWRGHLIKSTIVAVLPGYDWVIESV